MKDEYDFADAQRGKFYVKNATLAPPIHLEPDVLSYLAAQAQARGASLSDVVNGLLRDDIARLKTTG